MIADVEVRNREEYQEYVDRVPAVVQKHGGRYLARGGAVKCLAAGWKPERIVVIEFETADQAERCFASDEYRQLAPLRERSSLSRAVIVEGLPRAERADGR